MKITTSNASAMLRGEQRSTRYKYHHSVRGAAEELGLPVTWIWFWLFAKQLKFRTWLRKVWVRLESVQELFADEFAVLEAFHATGEYLTSPQAVQQAVDRWPDTGARPYIEFQFPARLIPRAAKLVSNPVLGEEEPA